MRWTVLALLVLAVLVLGTGCHRKQAEGSANSDLGSGRYRTETGVASYYADKFEGRKTASGEPYRGSRYTCAHRTLPFGTLLLVTNKASRRSVKVRVNDRGPWTKNRLLDVSKAAAKDLDLIRPGTAVVTITYVGK